MIDPETFMRFWSSLCSRFARELNADEAHEYRSCLDPVMDTAGFERASRHLWATREFFPRPADFLTCGAERAWRDIRDADRKRDTRILSEILSTSPLVRDALRYMGGLDTALELAKRDPQQSRKAFLEAFELAAADVARDNAKLGLLKPAGSRSDGRAFRSFREGHGLERTGEIQQRLPLAALHPANEVKTTEP